VAAETSPPGSSTRLQSSARNWQPVLTSKNLSIIVVGIVLIVAIIMADPKDVPKIVDIVVGSHVWATTGWVLAVIFLIAGIALMKLLMTIYDKEIDRIAKERDYLQNILINRQDIQ